MSGQVPRPTDWHGGVVREGAAREFSSAQRADVWKVHLICTGSRIPLSRLELVRTRNQVVKQDGTVVLAYTPLRMVKGKHYKVRDQPKSSSSHEIVLDPVRSFAAQ